MLTTVSDRKIGVYSNGSLTLPNDSVVSVVDYYEPHMVNATDYYAFGMPSRVASSATGAGYRFGFNGKENDNEVKGFGNQQDYGMRIYDPRIGRFLSVDPLTKSYPWNGSYSYSEDNPVNYEDIDGLETLNTGQARTTQVRPVINIRRINSPPSTRYNEGDHRVIWSRPGGNGQGRQPQRQYRYLTQAELDAQTCYNCSVALNPDGQSVTIWDVNGVSKQVSLIKVIEPPKPLTWVDKLLIGLQDEKIEQFGVNKQWNFSIQAYEIITNNPETLSQEYLDEVKGRILQGKGTAQDLLYSKEVYARGANTKASPAEAGVIYLRIDENGIIKPYIGQAISEDRYEQRQQEHSREHPQSKFKFIILARGIPGADLDRKEQAGIDVFGGPSRPKTNPNGPLSNKRDHRKAYKKQN